MAELRMQYRLALEKDEAALNALAKQSEFTRDFHNPPMSLKAMRKVAVPNGEVVIAEAWYTGSRTKEVVGFIWCRPMKPKHMPYSTVYYMGVHPSWRRNKLAAGLLRHALNIAKCGRIELVCEDRNVEATRFYERCGGVPIGEGTVGKVPRHYTRWAFTQGQVNL